MLVFPKLFTDERSPHLDITGLIAAQDEGWSFFSLVNAEN
jgi:hypothetical protein